MSENEKVKDNAAPEGDADDGEDEPKEIEDEQELGEGWYGPGRPAPKKEAPPVPSTEGRRELYTTVAGKVADDVFSDRVKSNRVWYTPEDEPEDDEFMFDVDVSGNAVCEEFEVEPKASRRGDFFVIKDAKSKADGSLWSVKALDTARAEELGQDAAELISREVALFQKFGSDPHICSVRNDKQYKGEDTLAIVLERCAGDELFSQISRGEENYGESDARNLVRQILSALSHVHGNGYVHRDINDFVFVFGSKTSIDQLLLVDFSFATELALGATTEENPGGVPEYQAPEVHAESPFGHPADVWSAGVLAFALLFGRPPFTGTNTIKLGQDIQKGQFEFPASSGASAQAKEFVTSLLQLDPAKRPTAKQALEHAWLKSSDDTPLKSFKKDLKQYMSER